MTAVMYNPDPLLINPPALSRAENRDLNIKPLKGGGLLIMGPHESCFSWWLNLVR